MKGLSKLLFTHERFEHHTRTHLLHSLSFDFRNRDWISLGAKRSPLVKKKSTLEAFMTTHFFPPFHDFAEALMASLASRSHEWTYWEIIEINHIDSSHLPVHSQDANTPWPPQNQGASGNFVTHTEIEIILKNKNGAQLQSSASLETVHSPSLFLDQIFDALFSIPSAPTNLREAFQSAKRTLLSSFSEIPLKAEEFNARVKALGLKSAIWVRGKNSEGQYLESVHAPKN
jgi:hypothetical protein